jgi:release factor glutamine methyltransferase
MGKLGIPEDSGWGRIILSEETEIKPPWTPLKIIQWAVPYLNQKGISNARFDIETLIAFALRIDRLKVYLQFDRPLDSSELSLIRELLKRRAQHEPMQYIIGKREFYGISFTVSPSVLIPRPETEQLVEQAIQYLKGISEEKRMVLDLGTGSGCIALSIVKNVSCQVWAVDISEKALAIAKDNADILGLEGVVQWRKGSWFSALTPNDPDQFQVIVSNPPYIALNEMGELAPEVKGFEPPEALFAGESGLEAFRDLAQNMGKRLVSGGIALIEINSHRYEAISELFKGPGWKETLYPDLQGLPRVLKLEK